MINEESDKCSNIVLNSMIFSLIRDIIYTSSDPKNREDARKDYVNYICEKLAEDELTIQEAIYLKEKIDDKIISDVYYKIASHYKEEIRRKFPQLKRSNIPKKNQR